MEYIVQLEKQNEMATKPIKKESFEIVKVEHGFITIKTDKNISDLTSKKMVLSIYGDEIQLKRKPQSKKEITRG